MDQPNLYTIFDFIFLVIVSSEFRIFFDQRLCVFNDRINRFVNYTRVSWTYIIKSHKEVLTCVQQFVTEVTAQYDTPLKVLRTDNALEFTQSGVEALCTTRGILHQTTCPYTSQQNGVAERRHQHLLDMVCTLLVGTNVPIYLWSDVVLTATFLVNRLPSAARLLSKITHWACRSLPLEH